MNSENFLCRDFVYPLTVIIFRSDATGASGVVMWGGMELGSQRSERLSTRKAGKERQGTQQAAGY